MRTQTRRQFLTTLSLASAAGLAELGLGRKSLAAEPPPETGTIRVLYDRVTCGAPLVLQELLRAEGFTDIQYIETTEEHIRRADAAKSGFAADIIAHGEVDFARDFAPSLVLGMNAGAPGSPT
jgi:NitT/TauT family transport system substrate-binding protein